MVFSLYFLRKEGVIIMMKRRLCLILSICIIMSMTGIAYAQESNSEEKFQLVETTISEEVLETISNIPVYVTYIKSNDENEIQSAQDASLENIKAIDNDEFGMLSSTSVFSEEKNIIMTSDTYEIIAVSDSDKIDLISDPTYAYTFNRAQKLIEDDVNVKYINIYMTEENSNSDEYSTLASESGSSYGGQYLGSYNGYTFLYTETSLGVESSTVTPGNISSSLKWNAIAKKSIEILLDHYVKNVYYDAVKAVSNSLSTVFGLVDTPLSITYSSSNGYIKAKVSGDLYIRTILISDNLDKVEGQTYYPWGTTEKLRAALRIDAKIPTSYKTSTTYNYEYPSYTYTTQSSQTPGYSGNSTIYSSIIQLYKRSSYSMHEEHIDVSSIVANLLN